MSRSLLLDIARESISEVLQAQRTIDKKRLLTEYPILNEPVAVFVNLYLHKELRGSHGSVIPKNSLLEEIIFHAKKAAFEDENFTPLSTSDYLQATVELSLLTPLKALKYTSQEELKQQVVSHEDGLLIRYKEKEAAFVPQMWLHVQNFEEFLSLLLKEAGLTDLKNFPEVFKFQVEKQSDEAILR